MSQIQTALIVGGNSFTGPYLAKELTKRGFAVFGTTTTGQCCGEGFVTSLALDLSDPNSIAHVVSEVQPNYVVHLAGISFVGHAHLDSFYRINTVGTENLLCALEDACLPMLRRVLVSSSANIYGMPEGVDKLSESMAPDPMNHYAISKLAMEFVAKKYMNRLPIVIARPFNYIGYGQKPEFVIPKIALAFAEERTHIELGATDVERDFTDVRDTVRAYADLLTAESCDIEVFNVCSSVPHSLTHVIELLQETAGYKIQVVTNPHFLRKHEIRRLCGANDKLVKFTGWRPEISFAEAVATIYESYRRALAPIAREPS